MPVYNDATYLREAVDSILAQSYRDFTLLIVDDGSTDATPGILSSYADKRIRILRHGKNLGRAHARNTALNAADSEYLAWMDGDDISLPERLATQVAFMDAHPHISVCGIWLRCFHEKNFRVKFPTASGTICASTVFAPGLPNPATCMRLRNIRQCGIHYDVTMSRAEDFGFWGDLLLGGRAQAANIPQFLFRWRYFQRPTTTYWHAKALLGHIFPYLGLSPDPRMAQLHTDLVYLHVREFLAQYAMAESLEWLDTVWGAARRHLPAQAVEPCRVMLRNHAERLMAHSTDFKRVWPVWRKTSLGASWPAPLVLTRIFLRKAKSVARGVRHG